MKLSVRICAQLGVAFLVLVVTTNAIKVDKVNAKRQVGAEKGALLDTTEDRTAEATGFLGAGAVQGHSKYFQDFFTAQLAPYKLEFGHVCENPDEWEQRYERKDFKNHRDQGKVRWGDKHGGYGEHYWDYNHAGHGDSHDEGSEQVPEYKNYEQGSNREKRQPKEEKEASLVYDPTTGKIVDQLTGRTFVLKPID